jgi:hypothetical protein
MLHAVSEARPYPTSLPPPSSRRIGPPDTFHHLSRIYVENQRFLSELSRTRSSATEVIAYLERPDANVALGRARLSQLREKRSRLLDQLRANRLAARQLGLIP